jgi:hypothetical protein
MVVLPTKRAKQPLKRGLGIENPHSGFSIPKPLGFAPFLWKGVGGWREIATKILKYD